MSSVTTIGEALDSALADNTRRAYAKGWNRFCAYCRAHGIDPLSATPVDVAFLDPTTGTGEQRMVVTIHRSKTDQRGRGQRSAVPEGRRIKPIARLRAWLEESGIG